MIGEDYVALDQELAALESELDRYRSSGCQLAENERDYRVALRSLILRERAKGTPVTIISDLCRGDPEVSGLRLKRDCAEAVHAASMEAINIHKLKVRILDARIQREWTSA